MSIVLRDYQQRLVDTLREHLRTHRSILTVSPTGSGKTAMFATIASGCASRDNRVLILVHRREILEQTIKSLYRLGITAGQVSTGRAATQDTIQVAMVGSLVRRLGTIRRPDLIISDEAHHDLLSNSRGSIFKYWCDVPRLGFTATPERLDGRGLGETYEDMILGPSIAELVRDGWLCPPILYTAPDALSGQKYHVTRGDFDTSEQAERMSRHEIVGDVIEHYREKLDHQPAVCFCINIEHARLMAREFTEAGYTARVVYGDMPRTEREAAIKGLADGSVDVVTSCDVISEGVDVPVMAGAILLRRTQSLALYLQQAGRALRPVFPEGFDANSATAAERLDAMARAGKPTAVILDHAGNFPLHGHVLADRTWTLDAASRKERKDNPPVTTTCPQCYGVWPGKPRVCPQCGYVFETVKPAEIDIKTVAGRLVEAGAEAGEAESLAEVYARAMKMSPRDRQKALLGAAFRFTDKRRVQELGKIAGYKASWSQFAWEYIQKKKQGAR